MKDDKTIKLKIVEYIAEDAYSALQNAIGEVKNLSKRPQFLNRSEGVGLDLAVLQEKLETSLTFINLLR